MVRDIERIAAARGVVFRLPDPFPAHSVAAARAALLAETDGKSAEFSNVVFKAEFADGLQISDPGILAELAGSVGLDQDAIAAGLAGDAIKQRLREVTAEAEAKGIFGAPMFEAPDGELFWGDDRLEQALAWTHRR